MSIYSGIRIVFIIMATMAFQGLNAQHYIFIEADGQQPFYLKQGNTMVSSSAAGFLILPKITSSEMEFSIGFPKNSYPEVSFYINGTDRDRGFQLKLMEGQGWSLFDRTSLEVIKGEMPKAAPIEMQLTKKEEGSFAKLLAVAIDDKSLLDSMPKKDSIGKMTEKRPMIKADQALVGKKTDANVPAIKPVINAAETDVAKKNVDTSSVPSPQKPNTSTLIVQENNSTVIAVKDSPVGLAVGPSKDTIFKTTVKTVENKINEAPLQSKAIITVTACDHPIASAKDLLSLQKKLLGIASDEGQRNYAVKAFGQKCFNTKQALEIGWFFVDENSRLQLFKALQPLIADKASFGNLEVSFLKEENIIAFRALLAETH